MKVIRRCITILISLLIIPTGYCSAKNLGLTQLEFEQRFSHEVINSQLSPDEKKLLSNLVFLPKNKNGASTASIDDVTIFTVIKNRDNKLDFVGISYDSFPRESLSNYTLVAIHSLLVAVIGEVPTMSKDIDYVTNTAKTRREGSRSVEVSGFKVTNLAIPEKPYRQQLNITNESNSTPSKTRNLKSKTKHDYVDYFN